MPDVIASRDVSDLNEQLLRLDRRARFVSLANNLGLAALAVTVVVAAAVVADSVWDLPLGARIGLLVTAGIVALAGVLWAFGRSLLRRSDPAAAAALIEGLHPELHERLSSAIEFGQEGASGSLLMRALVVRQAQQSLGAVDVAEPLPILQTTRRGALGAAMLSALLLPCLFFGGYRLLLERFATPWRNLDRAANLYFEVTPGDATVSRGADVDITATPQWRVARTEVSSASMYWQDSAGNRFERQMTWQAERGAFVATISHVLQPFEFNVAAGNTRTRTFHVEVVDRPILTAVLATIEPPAYSGRAVQQVDGAIGELQVLEGSRLSLQMNFNQPVDRADLKWMPDPAAEEPPSESTATPAKLNEDRLAAIVEFQPDRDGRFAIELYDAIGLANEHDPDRRVRVIADAAPTVRFNDRPSTQARPHDVLRFPIEAADDIGLAALEFHYEVVGKEESRQQVDSGAALLGVRRVAHEFTLDLTPLELSNGTILSVRARATDERPVPGPNESWTEPRLITISDEADPYESEDLAQRQQELAQTLQRLRAAVAENRQTTEKLQSQAETQQQAGAAFENNDDVAALAETDRQTAADAEQLASMLELHPLLESLAEKARNVARGQLTKAADKTQTAHDAQLAEKGGALNAASTQLDDASAELDAMQRDLESLAELEQDLLELQRLADDADRLAQEVDKLKQARESAAESPSADGDDALASLRELAADTLRNDHTDLTRRLDNLLDRRPELLDAATEASLESLDGLRDQALQLADRQQRLADGLEDESEASPPDQNTQDAQAALANRQAELVERAVQMANTALDSSSSESDELAEVARQSASGADSISAGDLSAAAEAARQAAEQAASLAAQSDSGPEDVPREEIEKFAAEQQEVAQELAESAASAAQRAAARQQGQEQLSASAQRLQQDFQQLAEQLASEPLNRTDEGARATESGSATDQAEGFMTDSTAAQQGNELKTAAEAAKSAVAQLQRAAEEALAATANAPDSPVPTDVGQQVAQASQQLRRAGEQLGDTPPGEMAANDSDQAGSTPRESQPSEGEQPDAESPMSESQSDDASGSEAESGQEGSDLAKAAAALQAAAQRLKPRNPDDESQASQESGPSQQPGQQQPSESASEGTGTSETARVGELAARIKARSMRNWGELPGELRSELQQRTQTRPDADYAPLIRMYFDEISRQPSQRD